MHEQAADTDGVGRVDDSFRGILEKRASQPTTLLITGDRKAREHDDGDRIRHVASEASRGRVRRHSTGCQGVVRNNLARIADDECA